MGSTMQRMVTFRCPTVRPAGRMGMPFVVAEGLAGGPDDLPAGPSETAPLFSGRTLVYVRF